MKINTLLLVFSIVFLTCSFGQRGRYVKFKNVEMSSFGDGIISNQVWASDGSFWAINDNGVIQHNGYFKKEFSVNDKDYCVGGQLMGLQKTDSNEFWLTYRDTNVITRINPDLESFEHFVIPELLNDSLPLAIVVRVKKEENGQLWLCTWGRGLIKFNEGKSASEVFVFDESVIEAESFSQNKGGRGGHGDGKGNRTGTGNGGQQAARKPREAGLYIKDIIIQDDKKFLITFFNGRAGYLSNPGFFDPETEVFESIDFKKLIVNLHPQIQKGIKTSLQIVHWAYQDKNGKYWLGTYSGPIFMDLENGIIKRISEKGEDPYMQNQVNATSYVVSGSEIWISTFNKGVMVVDIETHNVNFHYSEPVNTSSLSDNKTNGISKDPFGNVWVANGSIMYSIYTPYRHSFKVMYWKDMDLEYSNRSNQSIPVNQLYVEDSRHIYVSSKVGLLVYDFETMDVARKYQYSHIEERHGRMRGMQHFKIMGEKAFLSFDTYPHELNIETGQLTKIGKPYGMGYIGFRHDPNFQRRLYVHPGKEFSFIAEYLPGEETSIPLLKIENANLSETFSFVTNQGKWIFSEGTYGVGRFVLCDEADSTALLFTPSSTESFFPDSTVVCALVQEGTDEILIGTETDLYTFNEVTFESVKISDKVGLIEGEGVNSMVMADDGNIWMALTSELLCWNPKTDEYKRYDKTLGVDVSNFLPAIGQKDELGNLYFASMYGVLIFHPDDVMPPSDQLILSVSDIRVNDHSLGKNFGSFISGDYHLAYNDNYLEFDFYTNQLFELAPHNYSYQLEGQSDRWINCGTVHSIHFDNLRHGDYILKFKAENIYGVESEIYEIPFSISKPFWLTWWFFTLVGLSIIGLIYLLVKGRMKALKKRSELLEQTVTERTAEVVEQKKEADKQRIEAEHQKDIVEEKQKEITDSITYAKRIQDAILPSDEFVAKNLPNSFVMYRPKDIVAGDFYWMEVINEDEVIFAAADCTGHGVPGAMVSVVCNNALNRTVREFGIKDAGELLDKTRELVIEQFEQSTTVSTDDEGATIKDGMDIALCNLNKKTNELHFAGANNPIWLIRGNELFETKGDKQPIGKFEPNKPFSTHTIQLEKGDRVYTFSDGYADQFGGEKGKKFKSSSMKKLLLSIHQDSMSKQLASLEKNFDDWKGSFEQLDDVCVIGFEI
ncbi:MAG: hypothetical protein BM555_06250 [Crocinitomix sp. MedPE-SWsnd]|nr:MAG: hypothetical protein BM555_06250 [Crocinitomix sp. MedPE-SWsnd]